jgi:hypothetical protein
LKAQLLQSLDRLDRGEGVDGEEMFRRLRKRIKESRPDAQTSIGELANTP